MHPVTPPPHPILFFSSAQALPDCLLVFPGGSQLPFPGWEVGGGSIAYDTYFPPLKAEDLWWCLLSIGPQEKPLNSWFLTLQSSLTLVWIRTYESKVWKDFRKEIRFRNLNALTTYKKKGNETDGMQNFKLRQQKSHILSLNLRKDTVGDLLESGSICFKHSSSKHFHLV